MLRKKLVVVSHNPKKPKLMMDIKNSETAELTQQSKFFCNYNSDSVFEDRFLKIQLDLNAALRNLTFKSELFTYKYNPVEYAFKGNESYVRKYCKGPKKLLFVGMNPGPFGMCQTGVPFGDVEMVRDWLGIKEDIAKPHIECPIRKIMGFDCPRHEVSGQRLWSLFRKLSISPERFFKYAFVFNYCPLAFMKENGKNVTPSDMKGGQKQLEDICDEFYLKVIDLLEPEIIVGIGGYAEIRTQLILKNANKDIKIFRLLHPSPRVKNNQHWLEKAEKFLSDNNLLHFLRE